MIAQLIPDVRRYVPALDGLRALAVGLVLLSHVGLADTVPGGFGVTVFFWISGFLITSQLLAELQRDGRIALGKFFLRRALRLLPASTVYTVVIGACFMLAGGELPLLAWFAALTSLAGYYDMYIGFATWPGGALNPFGHLWSLAVEDHYYFLWPLALPLLWRRGLAAQALLACCIGLLAWRLMLFQFCFPDGQPAPAGGLCGVHGTYRLYKATDTRLDSIAWGALIAVLAASHWREKLARLLANRRLQAAAVALLVLGFAIRTPEFRETWRYTLQGMALSVLLPVICTQQTALRWLLERPPMLLVGRLSYSLYLWHWGAVTSADWLFPLFSPSWIALTLGGTLGGAMASYYGIEQPMLALRRRVGSHVALP